MILIDLSLPRRIIQRSPYYRSTKLMAMNFLILGSISHNFNEYLYPNGFALLETLKSMNYSKISAIKDFINK